MSSDANATRKELIKRGYEVREPTGRGRTSYVVVDPKTGEIVGRFPKSPSPGSWRANLMAGIRRYERGGAAPRSSRVASR